ncbi:MAG: histidinol phosphate phosphatase domain-containing protein [Methanobacterium formicicum]|jgi:histidinol phosphatase-like PHP family hydrolase|uniref:Histidinol phosphate phosphatase domain-containing protein n=1 Tax=Methanobacterium formicicum TaxID=2162 RepID=A0A090JYK3_METFO|nr:MULTISPECIES: histidinol phosphate phosphatase domain-containing protein [Methanobacterium]MBF4474132.1 histidinol phosphate phosphatase domain-containing protein [Methanobacterium formicicum]MDD4809722.1 histidinol phosphate phosphatase domain-containing protein [Methanobacterium formicicum]MDG3546347.1 histidinol phosphate phosphatase domain-containing protein [Methanobacterium formicicum]MDH2659370.1 histidinol phosphate phosphatase domain-containing protein [Methanobacterium formicicum]
MGKRIDLHTHSIFSDGELLPSEIARRACVLGHQAVAITDHVDASNLDCVGRVINAVLDIRDNWDIEIVPGAEITHAPAEIIPKLARKARELGAEIVVVHGETLVEPVIEGTNWSAVNCPDVDILAHPGLITHEEARIAKEKDIALEISARRGHSLGNGHVVQVAREVGANLVVDTDTHAPEDLINYQMAEKIALGAGLPADELKIVLRDNPVSILEGKGIL